MTRSLTRRPREPRRSAAERFLLLCAAAPADEHLAREVHALARRGLKWDAVRDRIQSFPFRAVAGLIHPTLSRIDSSVGMPPTVVDYAEAAYRRQHEDNGRWLAELGRVTAAFRDAGVECVVVKGPALMCVLYERIGYRRLSDIDLLVAREQASLAENCLRRLGYAPTPESEQRRDYYVEFHHHLPPFVRLERLHRFVVEIQWAVSGYRPSPALAQHVLARSVEASLAGHQVRIPAGEHFVLHAILDSLGHAFDKGIASLCDLRYLARGDRVKVDWGALRWEIASLDIAPEAALTWLVADVLVGVPMPDALRDQVVVSRVPDEVVAAAVDVALHKQPDAILTWQLVARARRWGRRSTAWPDAGPPVTNRASGSIVRRVVQQAVRVVTTLPRAGAYVRSATARLVLTAWLNARRQRAPEAKAGGAT